MRFPAWVAILIGVSMVAQWALFLLSGNVPELESAPIQLSFHLAAELLTAVLLIVAGGGALRSRQWARLLLLVAFGMLLYTVVVSPGYFAQRGQPSFVVMFGAILAIACLALRSTYRACLHN